MLLHRPARTAYWLIWLNLFQRGRDGHILTHFPRFYGIHFAAYKNRLLIRSPAMSPEVLLVESSLNVAGSVIYTLRKAIPGIAIEYVRTVSQALDFLFHTGNFTSQIAEPTPDLMLLSLDLPNEGSIELLRIIKAYVRT